MLPGDWPKIMERNRDLAVAMRHRIESASGLQASGPESMLGSMAAFSIGPLAPDPFGRAKPLQARFADEHGVVVGVSAVRASKRLQVRVSAHLHTDLSMVEPFLAALAQFGEIRTG
jgi:selenocysteine lyase/cysteine desulfurase